MSPRGGWRSLLSAATLRLLFRGSFDFRPTRARLGAAVAYAALPVTNVAATRLAAARKRGGCCLSWGDLHLTGRG